MGLTDDLKSAVLTESQQDTVASLFEHDRGRNCAHVYSVVSKAASRLMFKSTETLQRTNGLVENRSDGHHHGLLPSRQTLFYFLRLRCIALKDSESVGKIWKVSIVLHIWEVVPYADDIFVRRWSPCHHQIVP